MSMIERRDIEKILKKYGQGLDWQARSDIIQALMQKLAIERQEAFKESLKLWKRHNAQHG